MLLKKKEYEISERNRNRAEKNFSHWEYVYCCVMPSLTELHVYILPANKFLLLRTSSFPTHFEIRFHTFEVFSGLCCWDYFIIFFVRKRMPRFIYGFAYWAFRFLFRCARINIFTYVLFFSARAHNCARLLHCDHFDLLGTNGMKEVAWI